MKKILRAEDQLFRQRPDDENLVERWKRRQLTIKSVLLMLESAGIQADIYTAKTTKDAITAIQDHGDFVAYIIDGSLSEGSHGEEIMDRLDKNATYDGYRIGYSAEPSYIKERFSGRSSEGIVGVHKGMGSISTLGRALIELMSE